MIKLLTVDSGFEGKLIAARLGADGIICELRGGVDGPYPIGAVHVYVPLDDLELARDLMAPVEFSDADLFGDEESDELDAEVD
jgi:hypothetical protein